MGLIACVVFSGAEVVSRGIGHKGEITRGDPETIGSVTGADTERDNTGVTQGNVEMET